MHWRQVRLAGSTAAGDTASPLTTAQRRQAAQKNNKQRAKTNILRAFLFLGPTNLLHRRRILLPKVNFSFHESRSPCIRAQKPRFCARNAQKWGVQTPKAHKNPDFVLEMPENGGSGRQKRTKTPILCSGGRGLAPGREEISIGKRNRCLPANHRARFQNTNTS